MFGADQGWDRRGKNQGQAPPPPAPRHERDRRAIKLIEAKTSLTEAAKQFGLGRSTVYRELRRLSIHRTA
ncbi:helix-turn-helix domain-containing protein [Sinorhizobium fredii]|uniref:helix-turn-helix domain-containing protein n=1 Tax=Rhizobium fredii TaxID=380 RepID=UPI001F2568C7|nr:helix-turn-helix domain-containing protein [Sinorhizobium fredii]